MSAPEVVLVTGPPRAGVSAVAAGLRQRMPAVRVLDGAEAGTTPVAVVFVVSAVAPLTESDCVLADAAAVDAEVVVAVVSKIDDHRGWREVLEAGRAVADRSSGRLAGVPWLGVAAAPRLGEPRLDDLVDVLGRALADPSQRARNALRARQFREIDAEFAHADDVVLLGDFNMRDDENSRITAPWCDVWPALRAPEPGFTEDTSINHMRCDATGKERFVRFDRVLVKGEQWRPDSVELIGTEPISPAHPRVFPSDHFGLRCVLVRNTG